MDISLEQEFQENLQMHKMAVLIEKVSQYHKDKLIMKGIAEREAQKLAHGLAREDVRELFLTNKEEFDRLYNIAWEEIKDKL